MNPEIDDTLWKRLSAVFFGAERLSDERLFTARVMAEIRQHQPAPIPWRSFARWAIPALAISLGSFTLALRYSLDSTPISAETALQDSVNSSDSPENWLTASHDEDEILDTVVTI